MESVDPIPSNPAQYFGRQPVGPGKVLIEPAHEDAHVSSEAGDDRVLILVGEAHDADLLRQLIEIPGRSVRICVDLADFVAKLDQANAAILAEETISTLDIDPLTAWIDAQARWSDFQFILLTRRETPSDPMLVGQLGNVTLLERPFHEATLVSSVKSALRARRRQREAALYLQERERTEARQALLIRELHHRVRNTLSTIQGVMGATARSTKTIEDFTDAFSARIRSLGATHTLLTEDFWQSASLRDLLITELEPYNDADGNRIVLDGPSVELASELAVPTGMAIHELTTNAVKHGALSVPEGGVTVTWRIALVDAERRITLEWREHGGPQVAKPRRFGFGSTLLQHILARQARAQVLLSYEPDGMRFSMDAPLGAVRAAP